MFSLIEARICLRQVTLRRCFQPCTFLVKSNFASAHADKVGFLSSSLERKQLQIKQKDEENLRHQLDIFAANPDRFGTAPFRPSEQTKEADEEKYSRELDEYVYHKRRSSYYYGNEITRLIKEDKLKDALELFFEMQHIYRVKPLHYMYIKLIAACGRVGHLRFAFKLFKQMRDRGMYPTPATFTGLFNACAEAPDKEEARDKATMLLERIDQNGWVLSPIAYHAAIKAFGRVADFETAFKLLDRMRSEKHPVTSDTYTFLLMACASDKESGFTLALKVMRHIMHRKIRPSIYGYNVFLRSVRDCGAGPPELFEEFLESTKTKLLSSPSPSPTLLKINAIVHDNRSEQRSREASEQDAEKVNCFSNVSSCEDNRTPKDSIDNSPLIDDEHSKELVPSDINVLWPTFKHGGEIVGIGNIRKAHERLTICGGISGIVEHMRGMDVKPNVRTFSLLLACSPHDRAAEEAIVAWGDATLRPRKGGGRQRQFAAGLYWDVDFFNQLMKRRVVRRDYAGARDVIEMIRERRLRLDICTYGILAMTANTLSQMKDFLAELQEAEIRINEETFGALIANACHRRDFIALDYLLVYAARNELTLSSISVNRVSECRDFFRAALLKKENGHPNPKHEQFLTKKNCEAFEKFQLYSDYWLKKTLVNVEQDPLKQYEPDMERIREMQRHRNEL